MNRLRPSCLSIIASAALLLTACAQPASPVDADGQTNETPVVLTTFSVLADIAQQVAGEHLEVRSITQLGAEIHGYEPTPRDLAALEQADLILDNGLNLEAWFEQFIRNSDAPRVTVSDGITPISITTGSNPLDSNTVNTNDELPNPHAWMSPTNVGIYVDNMVDAFSTLSPEHASHFVANGSAYQTELLTVQDELVASVASLPQQQRALVTCEGAFSYLAHDVGLTEQYLWPVNSDSQATPQQIAATIDFVREHQVPAVFCESTVSDNSMQQVVDATDAEFGGTLYVDSLTKPDGSAPTYLDLIRHNSELIASALTTNTTTTEGTP